MSRTALLIFCIISVAMVLCGNLNDGDVCDARGKSGTCKEFKDCPTARADYNNQVPLVWCRRRFPLLVCCSEEADVEESECPPQPQEYLKIKKDGRNKARDHCIDWVELTHRCTDGVPIPGRRPDKIRVDQCNHSRTKFIIGGKPAGLREFPHQVLLGFTPESDRVLWDCGGTLISDQWVLTAGHCIYDRILGEITKAKMGVINEDETHPDHEYDVVEIRKHPSYVGTKLYNDIALLKLNKKVKFSRDVIPACLDFEGLEPKEAVATGFGLTDETDPDSKSKFLLKVSLENFNHSQCARSHPQFSRMTSGINNQTQICYGSSTGNHDTCWGDSGGPLQVFNKDVYCTYVVVGITSFGRGCGTQNLPGVYTRVHPFVEWIERIVWP